MIRAIEMMNRMKDENFDLNTDDTDRTDFHGYSLSVSIRVIHAIRVLFMISPCGATYKLEGRVLKNKPQINTDERRFIN